ncbi:MAG: hypothetical protein M1815_003728 [Lichina confinis]|nr:MAG: hypothetical protein M1815_003728 [Lichina confinis]
MLLPCRRTASIPPLQALEPPTASKRRTSGHACCEKTPSDRIGCCGNAGQTATFIRPDDTFLQTLGLTDNEAAERVIRHFINRHNDPRQTDAEKHLKRLVCSPLLRKDDVRKVLRCADDLFFEGLLRLNVTFVWSERFIGEVDLRAVPDLDIIGTTQIRQEKDRTFRARIVLSSSMLQNPAYDRRLVLSAVLHEAIHAYLFVRLGLAAKCDNGHTEGFLTIAGVIDEWFDGCGGHPGYLRLLHAEADLECFVARNGCGWDPSKQAWR